MGNEPISTPPDANPLGLVSPASSRALTASTSSTFTKKIYPVSSISRTDEQPSKAILNSIAGQGREEVKPVQDS